MCILWYGFPIQSPPPLLGVLHFHATFVPAGVWVTARDSRISASFVRDLSPPSSAGKELATRPGIGLQRVAATLADDLGFPSGSLL